MSCPSSPPPAPPNGIPQCGGKVLFGVMLEYLKCWVVRGAIAEIRDRTMRLLKGCGVEMLIIDEADRFKPKTFEGVIKD
ncbi:TniB family NTP-binding protein [Kamptonema sp. UHCC 0994]|uniref:TniB family NTP-binding protein n=1 Tax=Kamptonema sp. UHCC 0994 TaxID=3031329 RepID=UPI0023B90CEA|nr:TniB family NTP-binding protein [Kamptonema sp. UHCC 0994]MDF0555012.1 TniB family NTP-binding protein [Kamptonema sp. UHCC 0994]